jgi:hypothetical protein
MDVGVFECDLYQCPVTIKMRPSFYWQAGYGLVIVYLHILWLLAYDLLCKLKIEEYMLGFLVLTKPVTCVYDCMNCY